MFQIDLKGQNVFHKYAWEGDLKEMQNTVSHVQKIKSESFCKECLFEMKWDRLSDGQFIRIPHGAVLRRLPSGRRIPV